VLSSTQSYEALRLAVVTKRPASGEAEPSLYAIFADETRPALVGHARRDNVGGRTDRRRSTPRSSVLHVGGQGSANR
jgi:hypothetical protein